MTRDKEGYERLPEPLVEGSADYNRHMIDKIMADIKAKVKQFDLAEDPNEAAEVLLEASELASGLQDAVDTLWATVKGRDP